MGLGRILKVGMNRLKIQTIWRRQSHHLYDDRRFSQTCHASWEMWFSSSAPGKESWVLIDHKLSRNLRYEKAAKKATVLWGTKSRNVGGDGPRTGCAAWTTSTVMGLVPEICSKEGNQGQDGDYTIWETTEGTRHIQPREVSEGVSIS